MSELVESPQVSFLKRSSLATDYLIMEQLGEGGFGTVVKARHLTLDRVVAIKVVPIQTCDDEVRRRFLREAQILSRINDPLIAGVYAFGELDGYAYLVMEYLGGPSLDKLAGNKDCSMACRGEVEPSQGWRADVTVLDPARCLDLFEGCVRALCVLHKEGIVHRDIKPSNIVLPSENSASAKLVDFGLSKQLTPAKFEQVLTREESAVGTPVYMSPEQCRGSVLDTRSDIYSLACVMYELLTGYPPFLAETPHEVLAMHFACKPPMLTERNPDLKQWPLLDAVQDTLSRCLQKDPDARYATPNELLAELSAMKKRKRGPIIVSRYSAIAVAVLALACVASFFCFNAKSPQKPVATSRYWHSQFADSIMQLHTGAMDSVARDRFDFLARSAIEADKADHLLTAGQKQQTYSALEFNSLVAMDHARNKEELRSHARRAQIMGVEVLKLYNQFTEPESVLLHCNFLMNEMDSEMVHEDIADQAAKSLATMRREPLPVAHFGYGVSGNVYDMAPRLAVQYLGLGLPEKARHVLREIPPRGALAVDHYSAWTREAMVCVCNDDYGGAVALLGKVAKNLRFLNDDLGAVSLLFRVNINNGEDSEAEKLWEELKAIEQTPAARRQLDLLWQTRSKNWGAAAETLKSIGRPEYLSEKKNNLSLLECDLRQVARMARAEGQNELADAALRKLRGAALP